MAPSNWQTSLKHAIDVDPRKIPLVYPTRTALIVLVTIAIMTRFGDVSTQISVAIGITFAGLIDAPDELRTRALVLLRAGVLMIACGSVGMLVANNSVLQVIAAMVLAAVLGYAGIMGPRVAMAGVLALVLFCVYAGTPERGWSLVNTTVALAAGIALYCVVAFITTPFVAPLVRARSVFPHFAPARLRDAVSNVPDLENDYVRHGIRLAVAVGIATVISLIWSFPHAYWLPMTVVWIAKPDLDGTVSKVMYRVIGTSLGVAACILVFGIVPAPTWVAILVVTLGAWIVTAFLWENYSIAVIGMTIEVLALFLLDGQSVDVNAPWRIVATVGAGIIVVLASYLWKAKERKTA